MDKVLAGDIDGAMAQTEALAPGTLEGHPSLLFRLHCQTFLELVRTQSPTLCSAAQQYSSRRPVWGTLRDCIDRLRCVAARIAAAIRD